MIFVVDDPASDPATGSGVVFVVAGSEVDFDDPDDDCDVADEAGGGDELGFSSFADCSAPSSSFSPSGSTSAVLLVDPIAEEVLVGFTLVCVVASDISPGFVSFKPSGNTKSPSSSSPAVPSVCSV